MTQYNVDAHNTPANPTLMSTPPKDWAPADLEIPEVRSHLWRLVVEGNVAYHLTHNTGKPGKSSKRCEHQDLNSGG
jgi:hypothetical protein